MPVRKILRRSSTRLNNVNLIPGFNQWRLSVICVAYPRTYAPAVS